MLEARGAIKQFGNLTALDRLDLRVEAGEIVCLLGANGAGKSTTINLFLGFLEPDAGEIRIKGEALPADKRLRAGLGYVPDQVNLFPLLTGAENLSYFAALAGRRLSRHAAEELLTDAGLEREAAGKRLGTYSKGMRQKVGIAIALAKGAHTLLLDEPLSGLDPLAANEFGARLLALKASGTAILMATHDVFRAREIADRIGIMKQGRLVELIDGRALAPAELDRLYAEHMRG